MINNVSACYGATTYPEIETTSEVDAKVNVQTARHNLSVQFDSELEVRVKTAGMHSGSFCLALRHRAA